MKLALAWIGVLGACSSPATKPAVETPPARIPATSPDASPPAAPAPPDAAPSDATPTATASPGCFDTYGLEVAALDGDAIQFCDEDPYRVDCSSFFADGHEEPSTRSQPPLSVGIDHTGTSVKVCPEAEDCTIVTPTLSDGQTVTAAAVDVASQRLVVVLDLGEEEKSTVEVWDLKQQKRLARATMPAVNRLLVLDGTVLVADDGGVGLWRLAKKKLKKVKHLDGAPSGWSAAGPGRAVLVLDDGVVLVDLITGKRKGKVAWTKLFADVTYDHIDWLHVAGADDRVAVVAVVDDQETGLHARAGVFTIGSEVPQRYAIAICEEPDRKERLPKECLANPLGCDR